MFQSKSKYRCTNVDLYEFTSCTVVQYPMAVPVPYFAFSHRNLDSRNLDIGNNNWYPDS